MMFLPMDSLLKNWIRLSLYHINILHLASSAGVFQAKQIIHLAVFGAKDEPFASSVVVQF